MLINYGDETVKAPTDNNYMMQGYSLFTGGRGIYLAKENVKPGNLIKVYLRLQMGVSIIFSVNEITNGNIKISLGRSYFDYIHEK